MKENHYESLDSVRRENVRFSMFLVTPKSESFQTNLLFPDIPLDLLCLGT